MTDREKVIDGLEHCTEDGCKGCPYAFDCLMADGFSFLAKDALELLKEQGPVKPVLKRIGNYVAINDYSCPMCKTDLYYKQKYCDECGRAVKWDADGA